MKQKRQKCVQHKDEGCVADLELLLHFYCKVKALNETITLGAARPWFAEALQKSKKLAKRRLGR